MKSANPSNTQDNNRKDTSHIPSKEKLQSISLDTATEKHLIKHQFYKQQTSFGCNEEYNSSAEDVSKEENSALSLAPVSSSDSKIDVRLYNSSIESNLRTEKDNVPLLIPPTLDLDSLCQLNKNDIDNTTTIVSASTTTELNQCENSTKMEGMVSNKRIAVKRKDGCERSRNELGSSESAEKFNDAMIHPPEEDIVTSVVRHISNAFSENGQNNDNIDSVVSNEVAYFITEAQQAPIHYDIHKHDTLCPDDILITDIEAVAFLGDDVQDKERKCSVHDIELSLPNKTIRTKTLLDSIDITENDIVDALPHYLAHRRDTPLPNEAFISIIDEIFYVGCDKNKAEETKNPFSEDGVRNGTVEVPKVVPVEENHNESNHKRTSQSHVVDTDGLPRLGDSRNQITECKMHNVEQASPWKFDTSKEQLFEEKSQTATEKASIDKDAKQLTNNITHKMISHETKPTINHSTHEKRISIEKELRQSGATNLPREAQKCRADVTSAPIMPFLKVTKIDKIELPNFRITKTDRIEFTEFLKSFDEMNSPVLLKQ